MRKWRGVSSQNAVVERGLVTECKSRGVSCHRKHMHGILRGLEKGQVSAWNGFLVSTGASRGIIIGACGAERSGQRARGHVNNQERSTCDTSVFFTRCAGIGFFVKSKGLSAPWLRLSQSFICCLRIPAPQAHVWLWKKQTCDSAAFGTVLHSAGSPPKLRPHRSPSIDTLQ